MTAQALSRRIPSRIVRLAEERTTLTPPPSTPTRQPRNIRLRGRRTASNAARRTRTARVGRAVATWMQTAKAAKAARKLLTWMREANPAHAPPLLLAQLMTNRTLRAPPRRRPAGRRIITPPTSSSAVTITTSSQLLRYKVHNRILYKLLGAPEQSDALACNFQLNSVITLYRLLAGVEEL